MKSNEETNEPERNCGVRTRKAVAKGWPARVGWNWELLERHQRLVARYVGSEREHRSGLLLDGTVQQQRCHPLRVRSRHEQGVRVDFGCLAEFTHAEPSLVHNLAAIDERQRCSGDPELLHRGLEEFRELPNPFLVERLCPAPGE